MRNAWAVAAMAAALAGCGVNRNACTGMKYGEGGLTRQQYAPCAAEIVRQLDRQHEDLLILADKSKSKGERIRAKQDCMSAGAELAQLIRAAGGNDKLLARWDDERLNDFNRALFGVRESYVMACYYGLSDHTARDEGHETARQILSEIR